MKISNVNGDVLISNITLEDLKALKQWFYRVTADNIDQEGKPALDYKHLDIVCDMVDDIYEAIMDDF